MSSTAAAHAGSAPATTRTHAPIPQVTRTGAVLIASGIGFLVLALDAPGILAQLYALLASPRTTTAMDAGTRFGAVLFGALTTGWGATLVQLGRGRSVPRAVRDGALVWFVVDSTASIAAGYAYNGVLNVVFIVVILGLLRTGARDAA